MMIWMTYFVAGTRSFGLNRLANRFVVIDPPAFGCSRSGVIEINKPKLRIDLLDVYDSVRSPNLNAYPERWIRSVKEEALSKLILFGEASLRRVLRGYVTYFHEEQNHQGKGNVLLFPSSQEPATCRNQSVCFRERVGGLLKYDHRQAA